MFHVKRRTLVVAAVGATALLTLSGCSEFEQTHDHNTGVGPYESTPNNVIEFPYNFDNVARTCVDGDGVYIAFKGTAPFVVPGDPACVPPAASA